RERGVAAVLGSALGQIVLPDPSAALGAVRWLRETQAGSATVIPHDPERRATVIVPAGRRLVDQVDVDPGHWALAEALLGQVLLADDLDEALRIWREAPHPLTVVTLAGEGGDGPGGGTGGGGPTRERRRLRRAV